MKKIISVALALVMCLCLFAACAPAATTPTTNGTAGDGEQTLNTLKAGKLIMSTNAEFPPYEMTDDDGNYIGIDVEIATAIAKKLVEMIDENGTCHKGDSEAE